MELTAFDKLRCPTCLGEVTVKAMAEEEHHGRTHVESGLVLCDRCRVAYPIESGTPVMLRFTTGFHRSFAETHSAQLQEFPAYSLPSGNPRTGEASVQKAFTDEWNLTREDEHSFIFTFDQLVKLNRKVWLGWLQGLAPEQRPRSVLDVGCGVGMETLALRDVTGAEQLFGIDLNLALLSRRPQFRHVPGVNFVIASLFDLPFERDSFDLVYSEGVIHHTYSTVDAFRSIAPRVRPGGHLFVWVYGLEDHLGTRGGRRFWKRRIHLLETIFRPIVSRLPTRLQDVFFKAITPVRHLRFRLTGYDSDWKLKNTEHSLRDWLAPRYAHRHGFNEVTEWFEQSGFRVVDRQSPAAFQELFGKPLFGVGMTGERVDAGTAPEREDLSGAVHSGVGEG
jgi:SAM-dependent methyltransferase/uncharacterized protein YbaR (Trm112 family)